MSSEEARAKVARRLQSEATELEASGVATISERLTSECPEGILEAWQLRLPLASVDEPILLMFGFPEGYPFRPPALYVGDFNGPRIDYLELLTSRWSPALNTRALLNQFQAAHTV